MADIAAIATSTSTPAATAQPGAAGAQAAVPGAAQGAAPTGLDAMFAILLQELTPGTTPANDASPAQTGNGEPAAQPTAPTTDNTNMSLVALLQQLLQQPGKPSQAPAVQDEPLPQQAGQDSTNVTGSPTPANGNTPAPDGKSALPPPQAAATDPAPVGAANPATVAQTATVPPQSNTATPGNESTTSAAQSPAPQTDTAPPATPLVAADVAQAVPQPKQPSDKTAKSDAQAAASKDTSRDAGNKPTDTANGLLAMFVTQQLQSAAVPAATPPQPASTAAVGDVTSKPKDSGNPTASGTGPQSGPQSGSQLAQSSQQGSPQQAANTQQGTDGSKLTQAADKPAETTSSKPQFELPPQPATNAQPAAAPALHVASQAIQTSVSGPAATTSANGITANVQVAPQHHDGSTVSSIDTLGLTIAAKSVDGIRHFDIRLDPPELGQVQVQLSLDDAGKAQATLVVDKPQTLELLQRDAPNLNRALTDAGLNLSNNGLNFSLREQYRQNSSGGVDKGRGRSLTVKAVVGTTSSSGPVASFAPNSVKLDIRV